MYEKVDLFVADTQSDAWIFDNKLRRKIKILMLGVHLMSTLMASLTSLT